MWGKKVMNVWMNRQSHYVALKLDHIPLVVEGKFRCTSMCDDDEGEV